MKTRKTISDHVIAANNANAQKSTGPRSVAGKAAVSRNSVKHGLLAKHLLFRDTEEEAKFDALLGNLQEEFPPASTLEAMLIEELGVCWWKMMKALDWELHEIPNRRKSTRAILEAVTKNYNDEQLPIFTKEDGSNSGAAVGWDCQELVIQTGTTESEQEETSRSLDKTGKRSQVQVVARLNTSMETILRYQTVAKRDFYRAMASLRDLRNEKYAARKSSTRRSDTSAAGDAQ
jgi:hypothetical protein